MPTSQTTRHRAKRDGDGYDYRGSYIYRDESVSPGYWGRWVVVVRFRSRHSTLQEAKDYIDLKLDGGIK